MKRLPLMLAIAAAFPCAVFSQASSPSEVTLKPVVVTSPTEGPLQNSRSATRSDVPPEQLPQSVISMGCTQIDNSAAQNLHEVLRPISSVVALDPCAYAQSMQLLAEYAPVPHLNAGTPETAPPMAVAMMQGMFTDLIAKMQNAIDPSSTKVKP
jgi:hypothetical protein